MKYELNARQVSLVSFAVFLSTKFLCLPSLAYDYSVVQSLLYLSVSLAFDVFCLFLVLKLKEKNNNFNFFVFLKKVFGNVFFKVVLMIFYAYFILKLLFITTESFVYLKSFAHEDAKITTFVIAFFPIVAYMSCNGIKSIARCAEFFFKLVLFGIFATLLIAFLPQINLAIKIPFAFSNNFSPIFKFAFFGGDFLPVLFFLNKIKPEKNITKKCILYTSSCCLIVFLLYFVFYKLYPSTYFLHENAISDVIQFTKGLDYTTSVNIVAFATFLITIFIQGSIYFCLSQTIFNECFKKTNNNFSCFATLTTTSLCVFAFFKFNINIYDLSLSYFGYFAILTRIICPIFVCYNLIKLRFFNGKIKRCYKKVY